MARLALTVIGAGLITGCAVHKTTNQEDQPTGRLIDRLTIESQTSPVTVSMRGVSAVSANVCWASGPEGTVLRTIDGGETWQRCNVAAAPTTDFRDIHAFDAQRAIVMGIAAPALFYLTEDGGQTWQETYRDERPAVFFDGMDFWDDGKRGLAFSDPVDGKILIIQTADAGSSWSEVNPVNIPPALENEAGFAGSGTGIITYGNGFALIGLGGQTPKALTRILRSNDYGQTWSATYAPMASSQSAGIFSIALNQSQQGVAVGGDYLQPDSTDSVMMFLEGGRKFHARSAERNGPNGYRSVVAFIPGINGLIAAGPNGIDVVEQPEVVWQQVSTIGYHSLSLAKAATADAKAVGWCVGSEGRIAKITLK